MTIFTYSPGSDLQIFARIEQHATHKNDNKSFWAFPNDVAYDYAALTNQGFASNVLEVPAFDFIRNGCFKQNYSCVLTISVRKNPESRRAFSSDMSFSIGVSASLIQLQPSHPIVSVVAEKYIDYYVISVPEGEDTLIVSLTALSSGDPDLLISKGIDQRPTPGNYTWSSQGFKSD